MVVDETAANPWADAAANMQTMTTKNSTEAAGASADQQDDVDPDSCGFVTLYCGMQIWHLVDLFQGFLLLIYGCVVVNHAATLGVMFIVGSGTILTIRGCCGALALWTENICHRCGLSFSAGASPVMACTWFVLMCISLVVPGHFRHYLEEHKLLWHFLQQWENSHGGITTLLLLAGCIVECGRWQLVSNLQQKLILLEATEDRRARARADRRTRMADRPWWFGPANHERPLDRNDPLMDSLLPVAADRGDAAAPNHQSASSWSFLGRPRRNHHHRESRNVREDASVDFASVQDDWASRTEEDPFWWSREEDSNASPPTHVVSWAEGTAPSRR